MSTESPEQVLSTSIDREGLSIVTANRTLEEPRKGTIYDPVSFAAGVPVHFHAFGPGQFLGLFSRRWTATTPGTNGPQSYATKTEKIEPSWLLINAKTGTSGAPAGNPLTIPTKATSEGRFLRGACSRQDYLYTLSRLTTTGDSLVQFFRVSNKSTLTLQAEEIVPRYGDNDDIFFTSGLYWHDQFIYLIGTGPFGTYFARKPWSFIGIKSKEWEFQHDKGWSIDPDEMVGVPGLPAYGPSTAVVYRGVTYLTGVDIESGNCVGKIYRSKGLYDPWSLVRTVTMGPASSDLGSGVHLQSLMPHPTAESELDDVSFAVPFVTSHLASTSDRILVNWDLLPIPRRF